MQLLKLAVLQQFEETNFYAVTTMERLFVILMLPYSLSLMNAHRKDFWTEYLTPSGKYSREENFKSIKSEPIDFDI